jgi:(1->4)-alpha-D-glucan 1-alpha-D-glucosylmutase
LDTAKDGRIKLYILWKTLCLRRQHELLFRDGDYHPLKVTGRRAEHVCAYLRQHQGQAIIVLAPRLFLALTRREPGLPIGTVWRDTRVEIPNTLAKTQWHNIFTDEVLTARRTEEGATIDLATVFMHFPYGLLEAGEK